VAKVHGASSGVKYQRGIFGVASLLANVIIWGVIVAAVSGILIGAYDALGDHFRDPILAKWAPLITKCGEREPAACDAEWTSAMDANATLQVDLANLDTQRQACTKSVADWKALADRASAVADQNRKSAEGAIAQLRGSRDRSLAKSKEPQAAQSCEQILDELDKDSADLAQKRAILFPPEKAPVPVDRVRIK
jgi:hypothetical protein